jgi:8-oxo-dGTP pyrophosphatase MutT (NUDIX family)
MKLTARALVSDGVGRLLAIVHGGRSDRIGLPGGGTERGETPKDAARRELWEETGIRAGRLKLLVVVEEPGHKTFYFTAGDTSGTICESHEGPVVWATAHDLVHGKHGRHYQKLIKAAGKRWKYGC